MKIGEVKNWNEARGYGFLRVDGHDVFCHVSALPRGTTRLEWRAHRLRYWNQRAHRQADSHERQARMMNDAIKEIVLDFDANLLASVRAGAGENNRQERQIESALSANGCRMMEPTPTRAERRSRLSEFCQPFLPSSR